MSGIVAIWHRDRTPVEGRRLANTVAALGHRAIDGQDTWVAADGTVALAHLHFWTVPEEQGERQPLLSGDSAFVFDGRIDNRDELAAALDVTVPVVDAMSDARMALAAYERWGDAFVTRLRGPFAIVVWNGSDRRVLCARDPLGRRCLFFAADERRLVVASEPGAVLGRDTAGATLDEVFLAHYFAVRRAPEGRTMFGSVRELLPAHTLVVTQDAMTVARYWSLNLRPIRYSSSDEYGEHFKELLSRAVTRRMRAPKPPGVMMSGGLDSTSIAALAAGGHESARVPTALAASGHASARRPAALAVYSYVFDDLTELDERQWTRPMVELYHLDQTQVTADDAWPLSDFSNWVRNPSGPSTGAFDALNGRLFSAARADGRRVLLTGTDSDSLFIDGQASWLADLVSDHRYGEAAVETARHVRRLGLVRVLRSRSMRRLAARLTGRDSRWGSAPPPWLTPRAVEMLASPDMSAAQSESPRHPADIVALLESLNPSDGIDAWHTTHRAGIEIRSPFADLDLVTYAMSVPAYMLYNRGTTKYLLRQAMGALLPPAIHERRRRSDISALYWKGLAHNAPPEALALLSGPDAAWRAYVKADAARPDRESSSGALALVPWYCLTFEWWQSTSEHSPRP